MKLFNEAKNLRDYWQELEEEFSNIIFEEWGMKLNRPKSKLYYETYKLKGEE